jgi:hypothetical protein
MELIAIKGSEKYGYKVIEYLEKLGGYHNNYKGNNEYEYYFIESNKYIQMGKMEYLKKEYPQMIFKDLTIKKIYELWV